MSLSSRIRSTNRRAAGTTNILGFLGLAMTVAVVWMLSGAGVSIFSPASAGLNEEARTRVNEISQTLLEVSPTVTLLAGDSHAGSLWDAREPCSDPIVDASLAGSTAAKYLEALDRIELPERFRRVFISIGKNDLLLKRQEDAETFGKAVAKILERFEGHADEIVVLAIPPISVKMEGTFDITGIEEYSNQLLGQCHGVQHCRFADPYKEYRVPGKYGIALDGVLRDGVHLSSYHAAMRNLDVCGALGSSHP